MNRYHLNRQTSTLTRGGHFNAQQLRHSKKCYAESKPPWKRLVASAMSNSSDKTNMSLRRVESQKHSEIRNAVIKRQTFFPSEANAFRPYNTHNDMDLAWLQIANLSGVSQALSSITNACVIIDPELCKKIVQKLCTCKMTCAPDITQFLYVPSLVLESARNWTEPGILRKIMPKLSLTLSRGLEPGSSSRAVP